MYRETESAFSLCFNNFQHSHSKRYRHQKSHHKRKVEEWSRQLILSNGQKFEDLPLKHDLSFIRDLGHSEDIIYLSDVSVDYLHQPWRAFATIINKCLSGKEPGMDKDSSISVTQNPLGHEDTQVYGTILPKELTNQAILESNAYKTYYAFAFGEKTPKPNSGDGTNFESGVPDEQHLKTTGVDEVTVGEVMIKEMKMVYEDKSDNRNRMIKLMKYDQEGDDTNDDDEETDSDKAESDRILGLKDFTDDS
ncbi:hypothetical protein Tco_0215933 [Tanacetum coccineum]